MKRLYPILILLLFVSCNWDEKTEVKNLTKDFNLGWWSGSKYQSLFLNSNTDEYGGIVVISETVYAIGYDNNFIIAKQYPNLERQLNTRLFGKQEKAGDFIIDPNDSIYLGTDDRVYQKNGEWYHTSNGWNPPDSLFPFIDSTYYYIVDIRHYDFNNWFERNILFQHPKYEGFEIYKYNKESEFLKKRTELGVSNNLRFKVVYRKE